MNDGRGEERTAEALEGAERYELCQSQPECQKLDARLLNTDGKIRCATIGLTDSNLLFTCESEKMPYCSRARCLARHSRLEPEKRRIPSLVLGRS